MAAPSKIPYDTSGATDNVPSSLTTDQEGGDGYDMLGVDLLYQMDIEDITALRKHFFPKSAGLEWLQRNPEGLSLSKPEFIEAMDSIAGSSVLSLCAAKLFDTLDIDDSGLLQWEEVLDAIIEKTGASRKDIEGEFSPIDPQYAMHCIPHCHGEPIVKIIPLETETTFCYAIVSKLGRVGVYDGKFTILDSYKLGLKPDQEAARDFNEFDSGELEERQHRRSVSTFLTDAIFIADTYALLFAASDRSLHLYDATGLVHVPLCHIIGMPNVPMCMDYHSSTDGKPSLLFLGDDHGDVIVMRFHQARNTLFKKKHPDKLDNFYWMELTAQSEYVTYKIHKDVHSDAVRQITFCADNDTVLSCSCDPTRTLVVRHIDDRREPYIFKLPRGARCFHQDRYLHVLVTGSADHVVRLWNPVVTQRPLMSLYGHQSPIVDVRVVRFIAVILSLEATGVLKMWDINDECCMMTLPVAFPVFKVPGKKVEYGARSIFPGPSRVQDLPLENRSTRSSKEPVQNAARTSISGSNLDEIQTQMSALDFRVSEDEEWQRDSVVIACCNYATNLQLSPRLMYNLQEEMELEQAAMLPPPTKEHYASAPSPWRTGETAHTPRGSIGSKSTKSTDSSSTSLPLKGKEAVAAAAPVKDMHTRRTQHRIKQEHLRLLLEQGAPHLALDLHPLQPIRFSRPLPVTTRMREKGIDVSEPERLLKTRIHRESTILSTVQGGLSGGSSAKSSKSSKSVPLRRRTATAKGRFTPDWFADKVKSRGGSTSEGSFSPNL